MTASSPGYRDVVGEVTAAHWPVALVSLVPFLAYFTLTGQLTLALAMAATGLAAAHAFVVGIALGRGDRNVALGVGSMTAVVVAVSAVALVDLAAVVFLFGTMVCLPAAALGHAAWQRA
ncbi:hypothetical protein [Haloarchaeobius iranensis]|uniref:Uncharacterized protein n=1 Tax=Haloarchaeobius iranensis TaxID=996166 RepID=A0A1G9S944_9EURY|nr:hypothetical protein [Haloarchaeobius iranensis]SDM31989.1 hypothetical protein SAMN05192554_10123 [Haloarchaeobius iranensis]